MIFALISAFERKPSLGILASFSGFIGSLLSLCGIISVVAGAIAALLGLAAGYYTLLNQRRKYLKGLDEDRDK